jgi:5-methylcytosine-specific restriction endonuclease McrA
MFYIDREYFSTRPDLKACQHIQQEAIKEIQRLRDKEKDSWLTYYASNSDVPDGEWTNEPIQAALYNLFRGNCAFCGAQILTSYFGDVVPIGTVEHLKPKGRSSATNYLQDEDAISIFYNERVYEWKNYIWACKTCNNAKKDLWPYLNPCDPQKSCSDAPESPILFDIETGMFKVNEQGVDISLKNEIEELFAQIEDNYNINASMPAGYRKTKWSSMMSIINSLSTIINENIDKDEVSTYLFLIKNQIDLFNKLVVNTRTTPVSFRSYISLYIHCINQNTGDEPTQIPRTIAQQLLANIDQPFITRLKPQ